MVGARRSFALLGWLAASAVAATASAEAPPPAPPAPAPVRDTGVTPAPARPEPEKPKLWFRSSELYWDNSATVDTLGVGADYQSRNPVYEMAFGVRPRAYFFDRERESLSLRADVALLREFTNSDETARRGEWTLDDAEVWLAYVRTVNDTPGSKTDVIVRFPQLVLPTSNTSSSNGKILGVGVSGGVDQSVPLREGPDAVLPSVSLRANAGYRYHFTRSNVPTNDELDRVRLGTDGRSLPSDQLSGSAFAQHQAFITLQALLTIVDKLELLTELGMRYAYRYALDEDVELCGVVATGCTTVEGRDDASRYAVATLFTAELGYELMDELSIQVGYTNLAPQLGQDGQRRQPFYSHDARGYLTLTLALDELYRTASGQGTAAAARTSPSRF
jgi:hypothetical protein